MILSETTPTPLHELSGPILNRRLRSADVNCSAS